MIFYFNDKLAPSFLSNLPDLTIKSIIERYYSGDKIEFIIKDYQLPDYFSVNSFSYFPFVLNEKSCKLCHTQLTRCFLERSDKKTQLSKAFCQFCISESFIYSATEKSYEEMYNKICMEDLAIKKFIKKQNITGKTYDIGAITLNDVLHITALIDAAKKIDNNVIYGLNNKPLLAPSLNDNIFDSLINKDIIFYHKKYNRHSFLFINGEIRNINNFEVNWEIHLPEDFESIELFNIFTSGTLCIKLWAHEIHEEWIAIARGECLEYFVLMTQQYQFKIDMTTELISTITKILSHFSTSQCFKLIQDSCRAANKNKIASKNQLGELSFVILRDTADHHLSNNINILNLNRPADIPRSRLSMVLFNYFLKFEGDAAFYEVPKDIRI